MSRQARFEKTGHRPFPETPAADLSRPGVFLVRQVLQRMHKKVKQQKSG